MKILLTAINAKYIHSNLAVYSLKASAGKYEPMIELAEYTINHQMDDMFRSIYQKKPDLLFISCYIWNRREVLELTANIRKVLPDIVIWLGGPEVSYDSVELLEKNPQIDGVMLGEGEVTFKKLLDYYVDHEGSLTMIKGIAFGGNMSEERACTGKEAPAGCDGAIQQNAMQQNTMQQNAMQQNAMQQNVMQQNAIQQNVMQQKAGQKMKTVCFNGMDAPMQTLDDLPFVYNNIEDFAHRIIYYESSRGCPFSCSYCLSSIDKKVRFRSPELVERELAFFLEHKVPQVKFVDRTFNCNHAHAQRIWKFIQEHDNGVTNFHFEIAADLLNKEEIEILSQMRPGLVQLEIGVQTVNEYTLEAIHRTAKFEKITERVRQVAEGRNIHQHLDLIAGLPYEDYESFKTSFDEVYRLRPQELQLGFLKVLKGSEMYQRREEYGIVYHSEQPYEVLATNWITCDELLRLKEVEEMLEVYYNSLQFCSTMLALEAYFDRPFDLYAALADYYKEENLWGKSYSRQQRFEILRGFIRMVVKGYKEKKAVQSGNTAKAEKVMRTEGEEKGRSRAENRDREYDCQHFDELLTLDFYLRENAKSRPQWAPELGEYRDRIVSFYQREEQERAVLSGYDGMTWKQMMRMTHLERFVCLNAEDLGYKEETDGRKDRSLDRISGSGDRDECWVLFDYEHRNPLTYDAAIAVIEI